MNIGFKKIKNHLMTGMSYMIPMTVIGGIFYAGSIVFGGTAVAGEGMVIGNEFLPHVQGIGGAGLFLMIPVLARYIAYTIVGKPALTPGLTVGYIANIEITIGRSAVKTGFLGAPVPGSITECLAKYMRKMHYPGLIRSVVPTLVIPAVTSFIVRIFYMYILANPTDMAMDGVESFLTSLSGGSKIILGIIIGMMATAGMGGPVNKTACLFSIGVMAERHYEFFGICIVPICTAPLGMGPATLLAKDKYTQEERGTSKTFISTGLIGISEGAIPLAVVNPAKVILSIMAGGVVGNATAAVAGVEDHTPHGGPIILPIADEKIRFVIAIIVGTLVTAILVSPLKKPVAQTELVDR